MIPVTFQLVVNVHPFAYHLFEMDCEMPFLFQGIYLVNVPGVPNIVGPDAEFDNRIVRVTYNGKTKRILAQIGSFRDPTATIDEMKKQLPEWRHVRELPAEKIVDHDRFQASDGSDANSEAP